MTRADRATPRDRSELRADAQRSIAVILDAAVDTFSTNPEASMSSIARAAGVGRTTLYAHFPSREQLLDAAAAHVIAKANAAHDTLALDDLPAREGLTQLVRSAWRIIGGYGGLITAIESRFGPERLRDHHQAPLARIDKLIARGQKEGAFRTDLPRSWLLAAYYSLMHTAVHEVEAGRLDPDAASDVVASTMLAALQLPPNP